MSSPGGKSYVTKYTLGGKEQWTKEITDETSQNIKPKKVRAITANAEGEIAIAGDAIADGNENAFVARITDSGNLRWIRAFGYSHSVQFAKNVAINSSESVFVSGQLNAAVGPIDEFLTKYDSSGEQLFFKGLELSEETETRVTTINGIASGPTPSVYVTALKGHAGQKRSFISKLSRRGELRWHRVASKDTWLRSLSVIEKNTVGLVGFSEDESHDNPVSSLNGSSFIAVYGNGGSEKFRTSLPDRSLRLTTIQAAPDGHLYVRGSQGKDSKSSKRNGFLGRFQ
jgi:hypothetical protein